MHREVAPIVLRPVRPADRRAVAALWTDALGEHVSEETLASWEARHFANEQRLRIVAESAGAIVGVASVVRRANEQHAHALLFVDPRARRRGIGAALLEDVVQFAGGANSSSIRATADPSSLEFARRRGFEAVSESVDSVLDVTRWADRAGPEPEGLAIEPVRPADDDAFHRAACEFANSLGGMLDRADFDARILRHGVDRELQFFARCGTEIVAVLCTERVPGTDRAYHCLTAVRADLRGRGVARALKAHAVRAAKRAGIATLFATNDATNGAMLAVNEAAGFTRWRNRVEVTMRLG